MKQDQFYLYKLFKKGPKITLSIEAIADFYDISVERAQEYIKKDVQAGMIFEDRDHSSYYLSPIGFEELSKLNHL